MRLEWCIGRGVGRGDGAAAAAGVICLFVYYSQEFSRTENRLLGALARLDDFLMNPLLQGHSGTTPEASRNVFSISEGTNEDDSQSNPHPEAGLLTSVREDRHNMVTAVQRESVEDRDISRTFK